VRPHSRYAAHVHEHLALSGWSTWKAPVSEGTVSGFTEADSAEGKLEMTERPEAAPRDACVSCLKPNTTTGFVVRGPAEATVATLRVFAGIPEEQAEANVLRFAEDELGCAPGHTPSGPVDMEFRLCRDCAARRNVSVGEAPAFPLYEHPAELPEGVD
jgi:hypothetical protein